MNISSQALAQDVGVSARYVRKLTKAAVLAQQGVIHLKGERYAFSLVQGIGGRGAVYNYSKITTATGTAPKRKVPSMSALRACDLPKIQDLHKCTAEEKMAVIRFYNVSQCSLLHIVKALIMEHQADIKPSALQARIRRWEKAFKKGGVAALEDKRGGKAFKSDLEMVKQAILGGGSRHCATLYSFYCFLYAKKHNLPWSARAPKADVSESAFNRAVKHVVKENHLVKEFLHLGQDAYRYAYPSMGNNWLYPNQQWEVDATPLDLMIKVPTNKHGVKDFSSRDVQADFTLVDISKKGIKKQQENNNTRVAYVRVIDNFSKASVGLIVESASSTSQARLLHKAFAVLGMPEMIRSDRGSDYISKHLQGVIAELGITAIILPPASGNQKGTIERSFATLQHSAEFESLPGFIGHNVGQRQHLENEASTKRDKKSNVATNIKGKFMWHWEVANWIENYLQYKDADKYQEHAGQQLTEDKLNEIFRVLGKCTARKVSAQGIAYNNTHYMSHQLWQKVLNIGDQVEVRENMDDSTRLFVFKAGQYIGEVQTVDRLMQSQTVEQARTTQKAYKKRAVKQDRETMQQAAKSFGQYQTGMRNAFINLEVENQQAKQENDKRQAKDGFNPLAEVIKLANRVA